MLDLTGGVAECELFLPGSSIIRKGLLRSRGISSINDANSMNGGYSTSC